MFLWKQFPEAGCALNHLWILSRHQTFLDTIWTRWPVQLKREGGEREREIWLVSYKWVRQRGNQQNRTNVDENQQQERETLIPPGRLHQGGENKPKWLFTRAKLSEEQRWRQLN